MQSMHFQWKVFWSYWNCSSSYHGMLA